MRPRSANSNRPMAAAMTTAASALLGRYWSRFGASTSSSATASAPTTPVSCVFAPAASATGVRDELLLIGNPWKRPPARLAAPRPIISWFGSTCVRVFAAYVRDRTLVSANATIATAKPPMTTSRMCSGLISGKANAGRPCGSGPSTLTPARGVEVEHADGDRRADDRDQEARDALVRLEHEDRDERAGADRGTRSSSPGRRGPLGRCRRRRATGRVRFDREAEQLRQLADQHGERDAVHVAVADRLREQLGDEADAQQADRDAHETRRRRPSRSRAPPRASDRRPRAGGRPRGSPRRATSPARARGCGSGRTARRRAGARSSRRARRCRERPKPSRTRCRPARASSSARGPPSRRAAAMRLCSCAGPRVPAPNASAPSVSYGSCSSYWSFARRPGVVLLPALILNRARGLFTTPKGLSAYGCEGVAGPRRSQRLPYRSSNTATVP